MGSATLRLGGRASRSHPGLGDGMPSEGDRNHPGQEQPGVLVNDIHSKLNSTLVDRVLGVASERDIAAAIASARAAGRSICVAGGRHAMGGQQFASGGVLLDMRAVRNIHHLDRERGIVEVEAGIQWPDLIEGLLSMQAGEPEPWTIVQKQTGADRLSIGGALAANIHGRGLALRPIIGEVESFSLMDADGVSRECSRTQNRELFRHVIGGYGLFGVVTRVKLRLLRRTKIERVVELMDVSRLMQAFEARIAEGFTYGDFQFSTDPNSDTYMKTGVFSCYRPLPTDAEMPEAEKKIDERAWRELYYMARVDPARAFDFYTGYYLASSGQRYWSDTSQLSLYVDDYNVEVDRRAGALHPGTEMITELYVPRSALGGLLAALRADFRQHDVRLIYGTIRLIERDDESALAWAREPWACVVMNLHVTHTPEKIAKAGDDFRRAIDRAIEFGGSYFLTYHRWATRQQVEACHPDFAEFLRAKREQDPDEVFQSEWYRHHRAMFAT